MKDRVLALEHSRNAIAGALADQGISADRVTLLGQVSRAAHFAAHGDTDIALDTFPHGGGSVLTPKLLS